ncbi:hypothetical protein SAMN04515618_1227 [Collimonas sp. OK307]|nr:hypothetical protein SAMN04515618_1227 [Collimonas sp. OK307]
MNITAINVSAAQYKKPAIFNDAGFPCLLTSREMDSFLREAILSQKTLTVIMHRNIALFCTHIQRYRL